MATADAFQGEPAAAQQPEAGQRLERVMEHEG